MKIEEREGNFTIVDFNELEVYKIASKIEKDGLLFYEKLYNEVEDKEVKKRLKFLLCEEEEHLKFFEGCLNNAREKMEDGFENDDLLNYMDYGIFQPYQSIENMGEKINDVKKALRLGIIVEEKSIKFYQACQENISSVETREELQNIIEEEKRHKDLLQNILESLT